MRSEDVAFWAVLVVLVLLTVVAVVALYVSQGTRVISAGGMRINELIYFDPTSGEIMMRVVPREALPPLGKEIIVGLGVVPDRRKVLALFRFEKGALVGREPREFIPPSMRDYLTGDARDVILRFLESPENPSK